MATTPEIRILPTVSGTPTFRIAPRVILSNDILSSASLSTEPDEPVMKVLPSSLYEDEDGSFFMLDGTVTAADIKILYESNNNTNAYTDYEKYTVVANIDDRVDDEITDRQTADLVLAGLIESEANSRIAADEALSSDISDLTDTLNNYEHNNLESLQGGSSLLDEYYHLPKQKYDDLFPFTSSFVLLDWQGPSIGYYSITFIHNLNSSLIETEVWDSSNQPVEVERLLVDNNTITIRVPATPDLRFIGSIWIKNI